MKQQEKEKEYETYVKEKTPVRKPGPAMAKAFVTGGIICTIGQTILNACEKAGMSKDISAKLVFTDPDPGKCGADRIWNLSEDRELGRSGSTGADHRICRIPLRRRQLNTKKRGRFSELAARYLRSQDL